MADEKAAPVQAGNRWLIVVGALLVQLCLGAIYAWSAFTGALQNKPADVAMVLNPALLGVKDQAAYDEAKKQYAEFDKKLKEAQRGTDKEAIKQAKDELGAFKKAKLTDAWIGQTFEQEKFREQVFAFTATDAQWIFAVGLATFALVMILAGRWQDKIGPRKVALAGGVVLGLGYILAGFTGTSFALMLICVGLIGGAGIGLGYVCPIACSVKWFPDMKGFITGVAVAGFGAGAFIFIKLAGPWASLIREHGVNGTFFILGIIFMVCVVLGALLLSNPPAGYKPAGWNPPQAAAGARKAAVQDLTQGETVKTSQFWMTWLAFVLSAGCGLMVIGSLANFGEREGGLPVAVAAGLAGILALFNGLGRVVWGTLAQKLTARGALIIMVFLQALMMFILPKMGSTETTLTIAACWIGFNFGGNFALFPLLTAEFFGTKNLGANYGAVFTAYGVGGIIGPILAGRVWDIMNTYQWAFYIAGAACVVAGIVGLLLKPPKVEFKALECLMEEIMSGRRKPEECPLFGTECTPENAKAALMSDPNGKCRCAYEERMKQKAQKAG
ncbi:MAG: MFS transporter [Planctomycetota bacterium]|nr:MFS transporter [Planctomycetota bacterium]